MHGPLKTQVTLPKERSTIYRSVTFWTLQLVIAAMYFWAQASGEAIFASAPWHKAATMWGIVTGTQLVLTGAIRATSKRYGWLTLSPGKLFLRVCAAVVIATALTFGVTIATSLQLYGQPNAPIFAAFYHKLPLHNQLFNSFITTLLVYSAWVCGYFAIVIQRQ